MECRKIDVATPSNRLAVVAQFVVSLVEYCRLHVSMRVFAVPKFGAGRSVVSTAAALGFGLTVGLWGHSISEAVWATQWESPVPAAGLLFVRLDDEAFAQTNSRHAPDPAVAPYTGISFFNHSGVAEATHRDRPATVYFLDEGVGRERVGAGRERFVIQGEITPSLAAHVDALPADRLSFVQLDSVGGDVSAAISIARRIRSVGGHTYVGPRGKCFSSCGVIFQGGVRRVAAPDALFLLHYAKQKSADPMFALVSSVWGTVALIETMIDLGADPALYDQIPGMGDWLLTAQQAESIGIVQYVGVLR